MRRVIKIGTSTILTKQGAINKELLKTMATGVLKLVHHGDTVALITSGAVGCGRYLLGTHFADRISKSALAAVGQPYLMRAYQEVFDPVPVAQLLVDQSHVSRPTEAMALETAIHHLWKAGIIPLINENDALSSAGHRIGDNDTLGALVAGMVSADQLVILSDIDGLYTDNPSTNPTATRVQRIARVSHEHFHQFGDGRPGPFGSGGIVSKLKAAEIAQGFGIETILASGHDPEVWDWLIEGRYERATRFEAQKEAR
ncbi:MAG: glutamate 5-kinase [Firmicutes bacterium]|nr:glutamate 5-kinase [Bacillota bacterium]